jgi:prepilin-type N-terminal cleavage/methylation domain-containing protein
MGAMNMARSRIRRFSRKNRCEGFTLIEVMVAISIFAIGFLAISSLQFSSSRNNRTASEVTAAVTIATDHMERIMALEFDDPSGDLDTDPGVNPHEDADGKYDIQWVVTDADLDDDTVNDAKLVNLTVSWEKIQGESTPRTVVIDFVKPDF